MNVFTIEAGLDLDRQFIAPIDLGPAGQSDRYVVGSILVPGLNEVILIPKSRPGTDDAHVTLEYVEYLRQFIQGTPAQEAADPGDPLVRIIKEMCSLILGGIRPHGSELEDIEMLLMDTDPFLPEEDWSPAVESDGNGNTCHKGQEDDDSRKGQ